MTSATPPVATQPMTRATAQLVARATAQATLVNVALPTADDRTLAGRAADGDVRAFEVLVRRHGPLLRVYATRILGSTNETDDVVQETLLTAWQGLPSLDDYSAVRNWLLTIVTRRSIDRVRARSRHPVDALEDDEPLASEAGSPVTTLEAKSLEAALSSALSALPSEQRRCWMLREVSHYSYDDIADQLDLPASTVRGLLARARKTLIRELEEWR